MLVLLLILLLVIAIVCTWLRRKYVKWLFTLLAVLFWIAFLALLGFVIGYSVGQHGFQVLKMKL